LNVRDLLDVRVICETGSLRKAAAVLGVTQPTLSNRISHLEDQLGAPLFDRSRGHSQPTDLALFIASRASGMAEEAARLASEVQRLSSGRSGVVRIGVTPGPSYLAAAVAVEISDRWPDLGLDLLTAPTAPLVAALIERELDMVISPALDDAHAAIESELLLESDIVVVAHPEHPLCRNPPASLLGLFEFPIALPISDRRPLDIIKQEFGVDVESLPGRILCSDPVMLARIARSSRRRFAAGPRFYFKNDIESGALRIVDTPVPLRHLLYLHHNRDAYPLPAVQKVKSVVRSMLKAVIAT
jgi:DNA-binding transcriptional LysR family regulator